MTWSKAGFDMSHTACLEHVFDTQLWGSNLVHSGSTLKFQFSSIRNILELGLLCEWTGTPNLLNYGPQCIMCFSIIYLHQMMLWFRFQIFVKIMAVSSLVKLVDPYVLEPELVCFSLKELCFIVLLYVSLWMEGFAVHTLNCVLFMLKCWTFSPVLLLSSRRY